MIDILVIDDNRQVADIVCMMLESLGCEARPAYGSRSGILELNQKIPDAVFLDINMPGIDGFEVYSYIRRTPGCEHIPVFIVTSDDQAETARRVDAMGAAGIIIKPISLAMLENALSSTGLLG